MKTIELYQEDERTDGNGEWWSLGFIQSRHKALNNKPDTIVVNGDDIGVVHSLAAVEMQQFTGDTTEVENKKECMVSDKEKIEEYKSLGYVEKYGKLGKGPWWWRTVIDLPEKLVTKTITATRHETRTVTARYVEGKNRDGVVLFSGYEIMEGDDA